MTFPDVNKSVSLLEIATKTHDEHIRVAEEKAREIVARAEEEASRLISEAKNIAQNLTIEAEKAGRERIKELEEVEGSLKNGINNLRMMEIEYKNRLGELLESFNGIYRSYLNTDASGDNFPQLNPESEWTPEATPMVEQHLDSTNEYGSHFEESEPDYSHEAYNVVEQELEAVGEDFNGGIGELAENNLDEPELLPEEVVQDYENVFEDGLLDASSVPHESITDEFTEQLINESGENYNPFLEKLIDEEQKER